MADSKGVFYHPETGEILNGLRHSLLSGDGRLEYPDPVPMAPPVHLPDPARGMRELVQAMVRKEFSELAESREMESFEEADDFGDEGFEELPLTDAELLAFEGDARIRERKASAAAPQTPTGEPGASGGAAPPSPAATQQAAAGAPAEPIVKRSESASGTVAPGPQGS